MRKKDKEKDRKESKDRHLEEAVSVDLVPPAHHGMQALLVVHAHHVPPQGGHTPPLALVYACTQHRSSGQG